MTCPFRRLDADHTVICAICLRVFFIIASLTVPDILVRHASHPEISSVVIV